MFKNIISGLTKKWKIRLIFWIFAGVIIIFLLRNYGLILALGGLLFAILFDEKLKEGYFVKKSDFKKPLTHEFFIVIVVFAWVIALFSKKLRRLKK